MKSQSLNIGVLTYPISRKGQIPLSNLINILLSICNSICLITGDHGIRLSTDMRNIQIYDISNWKTCNALSRILNYIIIQIKMSFKIIQLYNKVDLWIFFIGTEGLILPMIIAKLLGIKVIISLTGFPTKIQQIEKEPFILITKFLSDINLFLANKIVVYSRSAMIERDIMKYEKKIFVSMRHYLDQNKFYIEKPFEKRRKCVGYIGALTKIKGVLNLAQAIKYLCNRDNEIEFAFVGNGILFDELDKFIKDNGLEKRVRLFGWIDHEFLPFYLNKFKLVILPSYTEGFPNIIVEASSCGTPVLATLVGSIPDVLIDGVNGFLMKNNSPESIADNVIRSLNHKDLVLISANAAILVKENFTFEKAVKRYRSFLDDVMNEQEHE